jgi:hypothetical protein
LVGLNVYNNDGYGIKIVGLNITVVNNTVASNGNAGIVMIVIMRLFQENSNSTEIPIQQLGV